MLRLLVGFLLGVGTTLIVVYWLDADPHATQQTAGARPAETDNSPEGGPTTLSASAQDGRETDETVPDSSTNVEGAPSGQGLPDYAGSLPANVPAVSPAQPDRSPQAANRAAASSETAPASASRDEFPPEIADMIANNVDKELQARYETDEREESWATYMEGQLTAYFSQKPGLAQFYISLIDCRTSVCSVHALGYGPDALTLWNSATADLVSQPWFEFNAMSMNRRNPQPDVLGIVLIVTKKPPA